MASFRKFFKFMAETWARAQGVSLNQFILWAVSEKVGSLKQMLDDPAFPQVTYRRGTSGWPTPVLRGTTLQRLVDEDIRD